MRPKYDQETNVRLATGGSELEPKNKPGVKDSDSHFTDPITGGCPRRWKDTERPSRGKWHVI